MRLFNSQIQLIVLVFALTWGSLLHAQDAGYVPFSDVYSNTAMGMVVGSQSINSDANGTATFTEPLLCPMTYEGGTLTMANDGNSALYNGELIDGQVYLKQSGSTLPQGVTSTSTGFPISSMGPTWPTQGVTLTYANLFAPMVYVFNTYCLYDGCTANGPDAGACQFYAYYSVNINITSSPTATPTPTPTPPPTADISVQSVQLAQVVYNPQLTSGTISTYSPLVPVQSNLFNAVQNKSASFSLVVTLSNPNGVSFTSADTYQVQIQDSSGNILSQSQQLPISGLTAGTPYTITADQMTAPSPLPSFIPKILGANSLTAVVVSTNKVITNSTKPTLSMNVIKTYAPSIGMMRISPPSTHANQYSPVSDNTFNAFLSLAPYLSDVFPVPDQSIQLINEGTLIGQPHPLGAEAIDVQNLDTQRRLLGLNRMVGVVDPSYYTNDHKQADNFIGYTYTAAPEIVMTNTAYVSTLPHELGRSFNVNYELSSYPTVGHLFNGFNADSDGYLAKNQLFTGAQSLMDSPLASTTTATMPWIDDRSYSIIFNYLQTPVVDPDTVLVTGILGSSGTFTKAKAYSLANGALTLSSSSGNLVVNSLDQNNKVINSATIQVAFTENLVPGPHFSGPTTIEVDDVPIAVELPASTQIVSIQVLLNGKEISKKSLGSLLLVGVIHRLPLDEFRTLGCVKDNDKAVLAQREKDSLLRLADDTQRVLDSRHPELATLMLDALILEIKAVTSNTYLPVNAASLSQSSAVAQIKAIATGYAVTSKSGQEPPTNCEHH